MSEARVKPDAVHRLAAGAAMVLAASVVVETLLIVADDVPRVLLQLGLLAGAALAAWYGLTRLGPRRSIAVLVVLAAFTGLVVIGTSKDSGGPASLAARIVATLLAVALSRFALDRGVKALKQREISGETVPPASRGVLIMNLKSGGGKAARFRLEDECRERGIEPIVLRPGDDLLDRARRAIEDGADVIGMAGGDGSQALVASIAADRGIPMVVVPAGTRNHLALDLGLDRNDVVGALDAFGEAKERTIDLAEVNGRVFVNNVSLGLYATIVRSPAYRDAKVDTVLSTLPGVLAPGTEPFDLRFTGPDGEQHRGAHVIQVSNGPYGTTLSTLGSRPRLDAGRLGVVALEIRNDREAAAFLAALATGHPERFSGLASWTTPTFEISSGSTIDVGLDGETLEMDPPLTFAIREQALRVRLPGHAIGSSPAARAMGWRSATRNLWRTAIGRPLALGR